jgi:hypothetical protein
VAGALLAATAWRRAFVVSVGNLASKLPDSCVQSPAIITSMIEEKLVLDSSDSKFKIPPDFLRPSLRVSSPFGLSEGPSPL